MNYDIVSWERAVSFHGHACPGLAQGFRASQTALRLLGVRERSADEELVAIVENDACGVDAVQALTGCTLGKGNLIFCDYGKSVITLARRDQGRAVRVYVHGGLQPPNPEYLRIRGLVEDGSAAPEDRKRFEWMQNERIEKLLTQPEEEILTWRMVDLEMPEKARLFNSIKCGICGEKASESRARVKDGKPVCLSCFDNYTRGW